MERIAIFYNGGILYWRSIIVTLASLGGICGFLSLYLRKKENSAAWVAVPMMTALSMLLARLIHWYSFSETYSGLLSALTDFTVGGFALTGVFMGCVLTAVLTYALKLHDDIPEMLDCMCIAGGGAIAAGRLSAFFNTSDRGQIVESIRSLPWVCPMINSVSGVTEYRLATFMLQSLVALLLFAGLGLFYIRGNKRGNLKDGDTSLIFLLIYGASQVVLDSTRYDSLFFRSNGFVSVVQVLGALGLGLAIFLFSGRMVKNRGLKFWQFLLWIPIAAGIGCGGFMEYYVQRRGNEAAFAYSVMSGCLVGVILLTLLIRFLAQKREPLSQYAE